MLLLRLGIRGKAVIKILQLEDTLRQNFGGFLNCFIIHFHLEVGNGYQLPATLFSSFRTAAITIMKGLLRETARCCGEGRVVPSIGGSFNLPSSLPPSIDIYLTHLDPSSSHVHSQKTYQVSSPRKYHFNNFVDIEGAICISQDPFCLKYSPSPTI